MDKQSPRPCRETGSGSTTIQQVTGIHAVGGGGGTAFDFRQGGSKIFISLYDLQNAEGFPAELRRPGAIFCFSMVARRSPGLRYVEDASLRRDSNP